MNCPNCGSTIKEGSLYCEHCGEDIHIVPDFEPELEFNIEQTISGIVQEINQEEPERHGEKEEYADLEINQRKQKKQKTGRTVLILVLFFLALAVSGGIGVYHYYSLAYQVEKAVQCVGKTQYDRAIGHYHRAMELDGSDLELKFALAEVYFLKNNKIEYEYLLREIIKEPDATTEQLERAYGKLIAIYRAREDYQTINDLLLGSKNSSIITTYQNYIAMEPEFSIQEGYYNVIQPLKLTAFGSGKIYFTMDGSEPSENSTQYTAPIILDDGDYEIKAYFVNDNGITSPCVTKEYHIEIEEIPAPEISAVSGEYKFPICIEILSDDEEVYYTTDGTTPTYSSTPYTGPIPMPLGKSTFKFVKIERGRVGNVAERTYHLVMNTDFTPQQAVDKVTAYAVSVGKIFDEAGYYDETNARYLYQYQYVININQIDDFYVVSEIFQDAEGIQTKTGNHFAVNAYTGELLKLQRDTNNKLTLIEIEKESQE